MPRSPCAKCLAFSWSGEDTWKILEVEQLTMALLYVTTALS